jgi:hypothetical protein
LRDALALTLAPYATREPKIEFLLLLGSRRARRALFAAIGLEAMTC